MKTNLDIPSCILVKMIQLRRSSHFGVKNKDRSSKWMSTIEDLIIGAVKKKQLLGNSGTGIGNVKIQIKDSGTADSDTSKSKEFQLPNLAAKSTR